jgi:class 3 adenylate cyclase/tetratricopeptide (TPR) repeat protein
MEPTPSSPPTTSEAERRQLTVMFCDLVGSTALSEQLDPEDYREVLVAYQSAARGIIEQYDGYIARYMGDGLLVYFGYPQAHEDDAERAVRAGIGLVDSVTSLRPRDDVELHVRIGIATGLSVVGDIVGEGASEERAALGEIPNLAARLQGAASSDSIIISDHTQRLIAGLFVCERLDAQTFKGIEGAVNTYRIVGKSEVSTRFEAAAVRGLTPLVGRVSELGLLLERWSQAKDGEGQVVLVSGEAGVGKSRIVRGFQERIAGEAGSRVLYFCSPYHANSALYPIVEQFERALRFEKGDTGEQKLEKLERVLEQLNLAADDLMPILGSLLSLPIQTPYEAPKMAPPELRNAIFDGLLAILEAMAADQTLLTVVEDAHWMDPSTKEFLGLLIERIRDAPIFIVITHRPELVAPWSEHAHVTSLALNHLGRRDCAALVEGVTKGKSLPPQVVEAIVARTDGIPLFVEELTNTVMDSGVLIDRGDHFAFDGPLPSLGIPSSLQDSLMARLDRLGEVKAVAQLAAVIGRTFSPELLSVVSTRSESELEAALKSLLDAGLVYHRWSPSGETYEFKHALVQDTAYQSLLKRTRREYHRQIRAALERANPEVSEELLGHHAFNGEEWEAASTHFRRAGANAVARSAPREAVGSFEQALAALEHLPKSQRALEKAVDIRLELQRPMIMLGGIRQLLGTMREAESLAEKLGDQHRLGRVWAHLTHCHWWMGDPERAVESGARALQSAEERRDNALDVLATIRLAQAHFSLGEYARVIELLNRHIDGLGTEANEGVDVPGLAAVVCGLFLALSLAARGDFLKAKAIGERTFRIAEAADHPYSLAMSKMTQGFALLTQGDFPAAIRSLEQGLEIVEARSLDFQRPWLEGPLGHAYALHGHAERGIELLGQALAHDTSMNMMMIQPRDVIALSEAYHLAGRHSEAIREAQRALDLTRVHKQRGMEADALRVLGEIHATGEPPDVGAAKSHYQAANTIAEELEMRPLQAHCHLGLGRLSRRADQPAQAARYLETATELYQEMSMVHWLERAGAVVAGREE